MSDGGAEDTMAGRIDQSRAKIWILMDGDRWVVAGGLFAGVYLALVGIGVASPASLESHIVAADPLDSLFQAYVSAIITGVTLVVTLNQLVLSQELGPLGDQRERMDGAMGFVEDVEDALEAEVTPAEPSSFFEVLLDGVRDRAHRLRDVVGDTGDAALESRVDEYVDGVSRNAEIVDQRLDDAEFGTFDLLSAVLNFNYSRKIFDARRLRADHDDALTDEADAAFEDLLEALGFFGPAREHFKTLYFQWELVNLSRAMLYAGIPALMVVSSMVLYYDARTAPGATLGISNDVLVVSLAVAVATAPFLLLLSFILRIATVAKRTLAIGPFVLRSTDDEQ